MFVREKVFCLKIHRNVLLANRIVRFVCSHPQPAKSCAIYSLPERIVVTFIGVSKTPKIHMRANIRRDKDDKTCKSKSLTGNTNTSVTRPLLFIFVTGSPWKTWALSSMPPSRAVFFMQPLQAAVLPSSTSKSPQLQNFIWVSCSDGPVRCSSPMFRAKLSRASIFAASC
jgi:hypothetical protein